VPYPIVPGAPRAGGDLLAAVTGIAQRVAELPLDEVVQSAVTLLGNVNSTLATVRRITDEIAAAQLAESLRTTLAAVESAVGNVSTASDGLPELLANLTTLAQEARALPLEELVASLTETSEGIDAVFTAEGASTLPASADAALGELRDLLAELSAEGGPVENASATLAAIRTVADEIAAAQLAQSLRATLAAAESAVGSVGTAAEGLPELLDSLTAVARDAEALALDDMVATATRVLAAAEGILASEATAQIPAELNAALAELRLNLATLRTGGAVDNANATLASLRSVAEEVAAARLAESLQATLSAVQGAIGNIDTAAAGAPGLIDSLTALSEEARGLPLDELVASASRVLATADTLIASEAVVEVPQSVNLALAELRLILADLREGEAIENASASLASVRALTEEMAAAELAASLRSTLAAVEGAVTNVDTAAQDLPQLLANLTQLSEKASSLPLEELLASSRNVLDSAERLLASDGMAEVPPRLAGALDELRQVLAELREGGAVQNLNATLSSADEAAAAVAAAANTLPALAAQLSAAALRAEQALASFGPGSDINRDTLMLLRELRDTAKSVNSLVVQLERRPNSVLFGR